MQRLVLRSTFVVGVVCLALAAAAPLAATPPGNAYTVTPLVSDVPGAAPNFDPNLVNGWGLARSATSPWWVADNGTNISSLYTGSGAVQALAPAVEGRPTGVVFAGIAGNFLVGSTASPTTLAPAAFIFASEDGRIRAWRGGSTAALVTADLNDGAIYKGLAIAQVPAGPLLYAADFHNARVDVFDGAWNRVTLAGSFVDPELPVGYAPFGIQTIGGRVFVAYAKQDEDAEDRGRRPGPRLCRCLRSRGQPDRTPRGARATRRTLGTCARARRLRPLRGRPPRRQLRRWSDQRVRRGRARRLRAPRHVAGRKRRQARDRRALGARVRQHR